MRSQGRRARPALPHYPEGARTSVRAPGRLSPDGRPLLAPVGPPKRPGQLRTGLGPGGPSGDDHRYTVGQGQDPRSRSTRRAASLSRPGAQRGTRRAGGSWRIGRAPAATAQPKARRDAPLTRGGAPGRYRALSSATALVGLENCRALTRPCGFESHTLPIPSAPYPPLTSNNAVGLLNPHPAYRRSRDLLNLGPVFFKQIRENAVRNSQFPAQLSDANGTFRRPASW